MKIIGAIAFMVVLLVSPGAAQRGQSHTSNEKLVSEELKRLAAYEVDLVLRSDVAAMARFYPDDMIVTNPFNQVIDKAKVLERVRQNIIRYTSMTKEIEHFRLLRKDMAVIMGLETAQVTPGADRPDAGKMTYRRFTEIWTLRNGAWKKIVRHANHFDPGV